MKRTHPHKRKRKKHKKQLRPFPFFWRSRRLAFCGCFTGHLWIARAGTAVCEQKEKIFLSDSSLKGDQRRREEQTRARKKKEAKAKAKDFFKNFVRKTKTKRSCDHYNTLRSARQF